MNTRSSVSDQGPVSEQAPCDRRPADNVSGTVRATCNQVWGGIQREDLHARTSAVAASLFSRPCEGGKGGDIYYFSVCREDLLTRIALVDVMGHGPAVSDVSHWLFDCMAARINDGAGNGLLADLNTLASEYGTQAMATAAVVAFYRGNSHLYVAYAGHPPALICHGPGSEWEAVALKSEGALANLPLGVDPSCEFDQEAMLIPCGARLFLYTDGLFEAPDAKGQPLGYETLLRVLNEQWDESVIDLKNRVQRTLERHTNGNWTHDDVTFMGIEVVSTSPD
jgi:phosphoserine phosphatase RsbU/P